MSDNIKGAADFSDDERAVSKHYKASAQELPSASLDSAVLAMAKKNTPDEKQTAQSTLHKKKTWFFPSSVAASIVLVTFVYFGTDTQQHPSSDPVALSVPESIGPAAAKQVAAETYARTMVSSPAPVVASVSENAVVFSDEVLVDSATEEASEATFSADIAESDAPDKTTTVEQLYQSMITMQEQLKMSHADIMERIPRVESERSINLKAKSSLKVQSLATSLDGNENDQQALKYRQLQIDLYNALVLQKQINEDFVLSEKYHSLLSNNQLESLLPDN